LGLTFQSQALYERITKNDREKGVKDKPFLDIVGGTSIVEYWHIHHTYIGISIN
jgi:hypothetical protein